MRRDDAHLAGAHLGHQLGEGVQVEDVAEALPVRLQDDGEVGVPRRHLEEAVAALALLPERGSLAGAPARQEQRPGRVLTEVRGEQSGVVELTGD